MKYIVCANCDERINDGDEAYLDQFGNVYCCLECAGIEGIILDPNCYAGLDWEDDEDDGEDEACE